MTDHETSVAWQLWTLIFRFLRQRRFQQCLAEDVAGDMVTGMMVNNSQFLQGGYPSKLPRCLCQEALSKAIAVKEKSDRMKSQDHFDFRVDPNDVDRSSQWELSPRQEAQYNHLKKFLGETNVEKLTAACGNKKPRQRDLAESVGMNRKRWKAVRDEIRATIT